MRTGNLAIVRDQDVGIRTADRQRLAANADGFALVATVVADFQHGHRRPEDRAKWLGRIVFLLRLGAAGFCVGLATGRGAGGREASDFLPVSPFEPARTAARYSA